MPVRTRKRLYGPRLPEEYNWTSITKPHNGDVYENTLTGDLYTCIDADEPNDAISWYIMPLPGSIPTYDGVVVSGAGTAAANGLELQAANYNNHYASTATGAGDPTLNGTYWNGIDKWVIAVDGGNTYESTDDVPYPWQATFTAADGANPAPTVTAQYLTLTGLPYGYTILGPGGFEYKFIGAAGTESDAGSWVATPKVYKAILAETATDDPTATELANTVGVVTYDRQAQGVFNITKTGAFLADKVYSPGGVWTASASDTVSWTINRVDNDTLQLTINKWHWEDVSTQALTAADITDVTVPPCIEFEVYP